MSTFKDRKYKEAEVAMKQGLKKITLTMFRWSPDYLMASSNFNQAAKDFKAAGALLETVEALKKGALCDKENEMEYQSGSKLAEAAKYLEMLGKIEEAIELYEIAAERLITDDCHKGAETYMKAGKLCESTQPDMCVDLMMRAIETYEKYDKLHFSVDTYRKVFNTLLAMKRFEQALHVVKRLKRVFRHLKQPRNIHKLFVSEVVINLALNRTVKAREEFSKSLHYDSYLTSSECAAAEDLLRAFESFDGDKLEELQTGKRFNYIDAGPGRLVQLLKLGNMAVGGAAVHGVIREIVYEDMKNDIIVVTAEEAPGSTSVTAAAREKEAANRAALFGTDTSSSMRPLDDGDAARMAMFGGTTTTTTSSSSSSADAAIATNDATSGIEGTKGSEVGRDAINTDLDILTFDDLEIDDNTDLDDGDLDAAIARAKAAAAEVNAGDLTAMAAKHAELEALAVKDTIGEADEGSDDDFDLT